MPMYEYKCSECGNEFEEFVLSAKAPPQPCPSCKSEKTERKISRVSAGGPSCGTSGFS